LSSTFVYDESSIAERFRNGDEGAFRQLFDANIRPLVFFAQKLIGSKEEAEDVVSTAFYKLWLGRSDFSSAIAIRSFLYTIVRNHCLNELKHRNVADKARREILSSGQDESDSIEFHILQAELLQTIYVEMQRLPEKYGNILEWAFQAGMSTKEIAGKLQQTESHVRVQKARALVLLRQSLKNKHILSSAFVLCLLFDN